MDSWPEEHYDHHCSALVDLTNPVGDYSSVGFSAWLIQRVATDEPVKMGFEGRIVADLPMGSFEIEVTDLVNILAVLDDTRGRVGVEQLLRWFE